MAKFSPKMAAIKEDVPSSQRSAMNVTEVKQVSVHKLRINPSNAEFFPLEDEQRFEQLKNDIRERGIIVPLLAKKDDTLLAGHNRLKAALELGLEYVPVQYVQEQLSEEQEREFLIKDNLLRRQFSGSEWIAIYRKLYPNFDQRIAERKRGGDTTNNGGMKEKQRDNVPLLTAKKISEDTGQTEEAVKKQLQREKEKAKQFSRQKKYSPADATAKNIAEIRNHCLDLIKGINKRVVTLGEEKQLLKAQAYLEKAAQELMK
jgi:hypothetical protein